MSRAIELAEKHGLCEINDHGQAVTDYGDSTANIEAFYYAARAEALREASDFVGTSVLNGWPCAEKLRAMADREGK